MYEHDILSTLQNETFQQASFHIMACMIQMTMYLYALRHLVILLTGSIVASTDLQPRFPFIDNIRDV